MRTRNVNSVMRHFGILMLLATIVVAGCNGGDKKTPDGGDVAVKSPANGEMSAEDLEALKKAVSENNKLAIENVKIPEPGKEGWEPSKDSLGQLGKMLDTTFAEMENVRCEARIIYAVPAGNMNVEIPADIKSRGVFNITYALPTNPGELNNVIGDGKRRAMKTADEWKELPAYSSKKKGSMSKADINEFAQNFTQDMFALYIEDRAVWEPLFTALMNGVGGYEPFVEKKTVSNGGKERTYIRVYAKTEEDTPTTIEVRIDELLMIPVTIRVVQELEDGFESKAMWTGAWGTGGEFAPRQFVVPATSQSA